LTDRLTKKRPEKWDAFFFKASHSILYCARDKKVNCDILKRVAIL